jgi:mannose-1-phosphate guanylyltransferase/phosphomannomutase
VCVSDDDVQTVEIHFYDKDGLDLPPALEKKVERLYFQQAFRRSAFDEIGEIIYPSRALEYYRAGLLETLGRREPSDARTVRLVVDMGFGAASLVLPSVGGLMGMELIALNPFVDAERTYVSSEERKVSLERLSGTVTTFQADAGAGVDVSAEHLTLITSSGEILDGNTALHAVLDLWCRFGEKDSAVVVPLSASQVVERVADSYGRRVVRTGRSRRAICAAAMEDGVGFAASQDGGFVFPSFLAAFDAVMSIGMLARLLIESGQRLDEVVAGLPPFFLHQATIPCPYNKKGAVMRGMAEALADRPVQMADGIKAAIGDGWVLVSPHSTEPTVTLFVEGPDADSADALLAEYKAIVSDLARPGS